MYCALVMSLAAAALAPGLKAPGRTPQVLRLRDATSGQEISLVGTELCGKRGAFGRSASPRLSSWPTPGIFWHWPSLLGQFWPNLGGPFLTQAPCTTTPRASHARRTR